MSALLCDRCGDASGDVIGLSLSSVDLGFCSEACFVVWVRDTYMAGASAS